MSGFTEKIAYVKGLCSGLSVDESTKEGRVILALIDALTAAAAEIEDVKTDISDIDDVLDDIMRDIADMDDDEDDDEDERGFIELDCPKCGQPVLVERETFDITDAHECPMCGASLFDDEEDDEDEE